MVCCLKFKGNVYFLFAMSTLASAFPLYAVKMNTKCHYSMIVRNVAQCIHSHYILQVHAVFTVM